MVTSDKYTKNTPDYFKHKAKLLMAWRISIFLGVEFLGLAIVLGDSLNSLDSYIYLIIITLAGMGYLYWKKDPDPLFTFYAISGSIVAQFSCWLVPDTIHYGDFVWITICCFVPFLGDKRVTGFFLIVLNFTGIGLFMFFKHNNHIAALQPANDGELLGIYLEMLFSFIIMGYLLYQFVEFQRIWEKAYKKSNDRLTAQNSENVTLVKEIHHRVKNNLQIIVSLLRLQKHELNQEESKTHFQEAINRVMVMSSIHQKLYQNERLTEIHLNHYVNDLVQELVQLYKSQLSVTLNINCSLDVIDLKTMVPVGLLINELVSNSFKYAFTGRKTGKITIQAYETEKGFNLEYTDNGTWTDPIDEGNFGMELISVFTEQLGGTRSFNTNNDGTSYIFELKLADS